MRFPYSMKMEELNLQMFSWIDMVEIKIQLIELKRSLISKKKLIDPKVDWKPLKKGDYRRQYQRDVQKTKTIIY